VHVKFGTENLSIVSSKEMSRLYLALLLVDGLPFRPLITNGSQDILSTTEQVISI
jgi:hypothetical protein